MNALKISTLNKVYSKSSHPTVDKKKRNSKPGNYGKSLEVPPFSISSHLGDGKEEELGLPPRSRLIMTDSVCLFSAE